MRKAKNVADALANAQTITELELQNWNHSDKFPTEIYNLPELQTLIFQGEFCTEIPDGIAKLTKLRTLDIKGGNISRISAEVAQLSKLGLLSLHCPKLAQLPLFAPSLQQISLEESPQLFPIDFSRYPKLYYLYLKRCRLKQLPDLQACTWLQFLHLEYNQLQELPDYICHFQHLQKLTLAQNSLKSLPADFNQLPKLQELHLGNNPFEEVPLLLLNMPSLRRLHGTETFSTSGFRYNAADFFEEMIDRASALEYRQSLYKIFVAAPDLDAIPLRHLLESLRMKDENFSKNALPELLKRATAALANKPLAAGSRVAVIGKRITFNKTELRQKLEACGLEYSTKIDAKTSHILIANKLDDKELASLALEEKTPILLDKNMEAFLQSQEERYLVQAPAAEAEMNIQHLSQLLLSRNEANIDLALQILKTGGVPKELLTELFLVIKDPSLGNKIRKMARQFFDLNASEAAKLQVSDKTAWYNMKDKSSMSIQLKAYFRPCELDRKKIALHLQSAIGIGYWVWFDLLTPEERRAEMTILLEKPDYIPYFYDEWRTYTGSDPDCRDLIPLRQKVKRMSFQKDGKCHYNSVVLDYPNLEYLDLSYCSERNLPEGVGRLKKLKELNISHCRFTQFPAFLLEMPNLQKIVLEGTNFGDTLPPEELFDRSQMPKYLLKVEG